jgi:L-ascorbate metabolism protein UlaG (beta-lactamase superfamily)
MYKQWRSLSTSTHYRHGKFENLSDTPMMAEGVSMPKVLLAFLNKPKSVAPPRPLPSVKTDLRTLNSDVPTVVWFGHSSYLINCRGINILVDPVLSGHASPFPWMVKAFPGADIYKAEDMPEIDFMIITHNHYDHLDKKALQLLSPKTKAYYTALGVGKDIAECCDNQPITEMDWWETQTLMPGIELTAAPARHFSGRGLKRGGSLWSSFVLKLFGNNIYIGADSGYDTHFKAIGDKYGPFDIAILECGQYNTAWPYIHMMPEQTLQAAIDLKAKVLLPVHWGKFTLALHPWDEPIKRITKGAKELGMDITTPMIGEPLVLGKDEPRKEWWKV